VRAATAEAVTLVESVLDELLAPGETDQRERSPS